MQYVIVNVSDLNKLTQEHFFTSFETSRKNEEGTKCVLKWGGESSPDFSEITIISGPHTLEEISSIMEDSEWDFDPVVEQVNEPEQRPTIEYDPSV